MRHLHKRNMIPAALLLVLVISLTGCGSASQSSAPASASASTSQAQTSSSQAQASSSETSKQPDKSTSSSDASTPKSTGKRIEHWTPANVKGNLDDAEFPVSFTNSDIELDDTGVLVIYLTVYDYERFFAEDITSMQAGDTLVINDTDLAVTSVKTEDGTVYVNGGPAEGGVALVPDEDDMYCETLDPTLDVIHNYYEIGKFDFPVEQEFVFTDSSDLDKGEQTYLAGDLLEMNETVDFSCTPYNSIARTQGGKLISIDKFYTP